MQVSLPEALTRRLLRLASSLYRLRRRWFYSRKAFNIEIGQRRARLYREAWEEAARECGGTVTPLDGHALEIRCGGVVMRTRTNLTSLDDPLTIAIAENKPLVYGLLSGAGIPVPRHATVPADDLRPAWAFAASLPGPCIVKPARNTSGAIGVTTQIDRRRDLAAAMAYGGAFCHDILIEEQLEGGVYRLLYFDGELLDAVLRRPPVITGDGHSSIIQLIDAENVRRMQIGMAASQSLVKVDRDLRRTLLRQGLKLATVPPRDRRVQLKSIVNDNAREDNVPALERIGPELREQGRRAAEVIGARLAGVDVITPDPSVALEAAGGAVIEVNTAPGFYYHYMRREGRVPVATLLLRRMTQPAS